MSCGVNATPLPSAGCTHKQTCFSPFPTSKGFHIYNYIWKCNYSMSSVNYFAFSVLRYMHTSYEWAAHSSSDHQASEDEGAVTSTPACHSLLCLLAAQFPSYRNCAAWPWMPCLAGVDVDCHPASALVRLQFEIGKKKNKKKQKHNTPPAPP